MIKIDKITDIGNGRHEVFLEDGTTFVLYKKEIEKLGLVPDGECSEGDFAKIKEDILLKRAKKRGLHLLERSGRSEGNLTKKLREGGYPDDVVEQAIAYIKSFGYLDDESLARSIVENRRDRKSSKEIVATLRTKEISTVLIHQVMEKYYDDEHEKEAIKTLMNKKRIDPANMTRDEKNKFFNYLARKGFSYDSIQGIFQQYLLDR